MQLSVWEVILVDVSERLILQETLILEITERLAALMRQEKVSVEELAERLGRPVSEIRNILIGGHQFNIRSVADILGALGYTAKVIPVRRP